MATVGKTKGIAVILRERVSAIIRTNDQRLAAEAMQAAVDGGFRLLEFTLTTPGAFELIAQFAKKPHVTVGAGTVLRSDQAREAVAAGATFIVSPIIDPILMEEAAALDVVCIPGAFTPTEMEMAHRRGADFIKVFPAPFGGLQFIEAVRAPLPHLPLFPTAGVDENNVIDYLNAGCAGAGFVKTLFTPRDMSERDFAAIRSRAAVITRRVSEWQRSHS